MLILWTSRLKKNPMFCWIASRLEQIYQSTTIPLFTQKKRDKSRSHSIDFLRFLLAFWVLLAHMVPWFLYTNETSNRGVSKVFFILNLAFVKGFQKYGETHPAVLGFIFLSGYCVHRNGFRFGLPSSFKRFFVRRAFRILPLYWLGILTGVFLFFKSFALSPLKAAALLGTSSIGILPILVKFFGISSFIPSLFKVSYQGNGILTTVMVEIWLYIAYGLIYFLCLRKVPLKKIVLTLGIVWALSFFLVLVYPAYRGWWHNGSFVSFSIYWWLGAYFVEFKEKRNFFIKKFIVLASLCVTLSPFIKLFIFSELKKISVVYLIGLLILKIESRKRDIPSALGSVGNISYSLYALHGPIIVYCFLIGLNFFSTLTLLFFIVFFVYTFFEAPLMSFGKMKVLQSG